MADRNVRHPDLVDIEGLLRSRGWFAGRREAEAFEDVADARTREWGFDRQRHCRGDISTHAGTRQFGSFPSTAR